MTDTKRLAKLMRHCCGTIEEIMSHPLEDQEAARRLTELETQILTYWPWLGYSKLLAMRHEINDLVVS